MDFEFLDFREKFKGTTSLFACLLYASVYAMLFTHSGEPIIFQAASLKLQWKRSDLEENALAFNENV